MNVNIYGLVIIFKDFIINIKFIGMKKLIKFRLHKIFNKKNKLDLNMRRKKNYYNKINLMY